MYLLLTGGVVIYNLADVIYGWPFKSDMASVRSTSIQVDSSIDPSRAEEMPLKRSITWVALLGRLSVPHFNIGFQIGTQTLQNQVGSKVADL